MVDTDNTHEAENESGEQFLGLLARFEDPHSLVEACDHARLAGYTKMDAFSPFPVHGIDDAIGIKRTKLPVIVFCVAMMACGIGLLLQWYTNSYTQDSPIFPGYPFKISGKAMFSLPANIPVTFEIIVLLSAFTAFFGMWILNGLPKLSNPLFKHPEFRRSTSDGFFLFIDKEDGSFNQTSTQDELMDWGAAEVDPIATQEEELHVPGYFKLVGLILVSLLLVPPVMIFRAQYTKNPLPRLHVNPDMDRQHRAEAQDASPKLGDGYLFADERAMRKDPAGTIARGELGMIEDVEFYAGIKHGSMTRDKLAKANSGEVSDTTASQQQPELDWLEEYPAAIREKLSSKETGIQFYERGKRQFDIYCSVCHGYAAYGDGHVSKRGLVLNVQQKAEWVQAKSLYDPVVMKQPVGRIFDTITNGRGGMGPYRSQITAEDRWAIIFFVKALQNTKNGEKQDVPEDARLESWEQVDPAPAAADSGQSENKK